jgi:hypothetical protein
MLCYVVCCITLTVPSSLPLTSLPAHSVKHRTVPDETPKIVPEAREFTQYKHLQSAHQHI